VEKGGNDSVQKGEKAIEERYKRTEKCRLEARGISNGRTKRIPRAQFAEQATQIQDSKINAPNENEKANGPNEFNEANEPSDFSKPNSPNEHKEPA
jgi:hypothetical protein